MRKKIITGFAAAGLAVVAFAGSASAAPGAPGTPADGKCVAANVKVLGPNGTIAAVARGDVPGLTVSGVIKDHLAGNGLAVDCD